MTPAEILATVRAQAYETSESFWTDAEVYSYMWQCEQDIAAEIECVESTDTSTTTVADTQEYTKPTDCLIIKRVTWQGVKLKKITLTGQDQMDGPTYGSSVDTGQPHSYYEYGDNIGLYPIPDDAQALKYWYISDPSEVTSTSTAFSVPRIFHTCFSDYCLWRMYAKDQDDGRASLHLGNYERQFDRAKKKWSRRNGADAFNVVLDEYYYPQTEQGII